MSWLDVEPSRRGCESFLRVVPDLNVLPPTIQAAIGQQHAPDSIRKVIYIPPQQYPLSRSFLGYALTFGERQTPMRFLVFAEGQITLIEGREAEAVFPIPLKDLLMIRLVSVLLYSYCELVWCNGVQSQTVRVEFNTVGMDYLYRELEYVRAWMIAQTAPTDRDPSPEFSIHHFPLKFRNYTRLSLLPNEHVRFGLYEPMIPTTKWFLGAPLAPNRAISLTEQQLLVVSDRSSDTYESSLGSYLTELWFCPRQQITQATFEVADELVGLNLALGGGHHTLRLLLRPPHAAQLQTNLEGWLNHQGSYNPQYHPN